MQIHYEDDKVIVVNKAPGDDSEKLAASLGVYVVHRLDMPVSGLIIYAKTKDVASSLTRQIQEGLFEKEYIAYLSANEDKITTPLEEEGRLADLLLWDRNKRKSFVVNRKRGGVKEASLRYKILGTSTAADGTKLTKVRVKLETGRTHQIRVQFSSRGYPLAGDGKYGSKVKGRLELYSCRIACTVGNKPMEFVLEA